VPVAGGQERVDVSGGAASCDGSQREVLERVGEELGGEGDGESLADERANGELVVGDRDEVGSEAGGLAGSNDEAAGRGGGPVVVAEIGEANLPLVGQAVVGREHDHELLAQEVAALEVGFMSGNQQDPDMICEIFVLGPSEFTQ
jgi:hypothetical protein